MIRVSTSRRNPPTSGVKSECLHLLASPVKFFSSSYLDLLSSRYLEYFTCDNTLNERSQPCCPNISPQDIAINAIDSETDEGDSCIPFGSRFLLLASPSPHYLHSMLDEGCTSSNTHSFISRSLYSSSTTSCVTTQILGNILG